VIRGTVTDEGVPVLQLEVAGRTWPAVVDTGFSGYVELPNILRGAVHAESIGFIESLLAAGQVVVEENFAVQFAFDDRQLEVEATFAAGAEILIGTALLRDYRLDIHFPRRTVILEHVN
jgi:predicted aspartyl protease